MLLLFASWRAAVIAMIVVPVSLLAAAFVLGVRGATFRTIKVLGLAAAVGLVIDDVVTDMDAVRRRVALGRGAEQEPVNTTVLALGPTRDDPPSSVQPAEQAPRAILAAFTT